MRNLFLSNVFRRTLLGAAMITVLSTSPFGREFKPLNQAQISPKPRARPTARLAAKGSLGLRKSAVFADGLTTSFVTPPDTAKPRVYWWWLFNRVDKAGITRDLEEFKAKGISGVNLICTGGYAGVKPLLGVKYQSHEWWALFRYAVKEAKRLNIEFGFNLSAGGWTMEGPWVTPENAMKRLVQSSLTIQGPTHLSERLPHPEVVDGYYHDYCVQAIPRMESGVVAPNRIVDLTAKLRPDGRLDWAVPPGRWTLLRTGYTLSGALWSKWHAYPTTPEADTFEGGEGYEIDYLDPKAFDQHFERLGRPILNAVRQAGGRLDYFWSDSWECGKLTWTKRFPDRFRKLRGYDLKPYLAALPGAIRFADYTAAFTANAPTQKLAFVGTNLAGGDNTVFIDDVKVAGKGFGFESPVIGGGNYRYAPTGGDWSFGGASGNGSGIVANGSGFRNPAAPQGTQAAFIQGHGEMSTTITGLVPGKRYTVTFSAEPRPGNSQTWNLDVDGATIGRFKPRTGLTVVNDDVSRRFRADFDRTIEDCLGDDFYGHFADVCHKNGVIMGSEAAGPNNIPPEDALKNLGRCDFPAGEFWVNGHYNAPGGYNQDRWLRLNLKQTASAAHVYGRRQAEAESFTQQEPGRTHWSLGPAELKPYANDAFCEGINRIMLHQATCQPPSDGKPGYEFCAGQHFNPNSTWWEQSPAFFTYLSRCSSMLQRGHFVGDVCYYLGEEPPSLAPPKSIVPDLGTGYDCDYCNAEVLIKRMSVRHGRIVLPDGMSYRLLALQNRVSQDPEIARQVGAYQGLEVPTTPSRAMSVEVIRKLRELVRAGATIVGPPPEEAAGLREYPRRDGQVRAIATELWGDLDGKTRTVRRFGRGRVVWGRSPRQVLLADGVEPDCTFSGQTEKPDELDYIHRTSDEGEIYFVINRTNRSTSRDFTFRVGGKRPEIFDPVTGDVRPASAFRQTNGRTTVPLRFDRFGSYFVVFRKSIRRDAAGRAVGNFPDLVQRQALEGPWEVAFDPAWGGPRRADFPDLVSWTKRPEEGVKFYSGKATYRKSFDLDSVDRSKGLFLDLGTVKEVAEVRLNGKKLGVLWCSPWRVDISRAAKPKGNVLEVDVINLWANRVIGDLSLPKEKRIAKTHDAFRFDMLTAQTTPLDSGLLGPVWIEQKSR